MLRFNKIHKTFNKNSDNPLHLYDNLNVQIDPGEFVSIIAQMGRVNQRYLIYCAVKFWQIKVMSYLMENNSIKRKYMNDLKRYLVYTKTL